MSETETVTHLPEKGDLFGSTALCGTTASNALGGILRMSVQFADIGCSICTDLIAADVKGETFCATCCTTRGRETSGMVCPHCRRDYSGKSVYDAWWTINGRDLLAALKRASEGDDPDLVYAELYANSSIDAEASDE